MRKFTYRGPSARELRRAAFRAEVRRTKAQLKLAIPEERITRADVVHYLQSMGASWRDFGLVYRPGGPVLGPPVPNSLTWKKDGIPVGVRGDS